ncbi:unnamed protein product [marine sediment metagenome]|uniref:VRR-NUC domain-containing protein n=1 Tax=marine sediment metagenome TaxID=412755 RepID=X1LLN1_9ZZZZ
MPKQGPEYRFRTRLCRRFDWAGYVAVKCAGSRPFDLIVMKGSYVAAVELKALGEDIGPEQREMQVRLAEQAGIDLILLRQYPEGKVLAVNLLEGDLSERALQMLKEVLEGFLVVE